MGLARGNTWARAPPTRSRLLTVGGRARWGRSEVADRRPLRVVRETQLPRPVPGVLPQQRARPLDRGAHPLEGGVVVPQVLGAPLPLRLSHRLLLLLRVG